MSVYPATNSNEAVELIIDGGNQLHDIINGTALETIITESGEIPSVRKALADTFLFKDPIPWAQGTEETAFNQLRIFNKLLYWAPTATSENPISMGVTPDGDLNWNVAPYSTSKEYFEGLVKNLQTSIFGQEVFQGGDEEYLKNEDVVPTGVNYLRVNTSKGLRIVKFSPLSSGTVSELSDTSAKIGGTFVKFSLAVEVELSSVNDLFNFKKFLEGDKVKTAKFNTDVDQNWLITSSPSAGSFNLNLGDGLFAEEVSNVKYFESFGAFGNGTDLDDSAFSFAKAYAGTVLGQPEATYNISQSYDLTNTAKWNGNWAKIKLTGNNYFVTVSGGCKLENFDVDGLDEDHTAYPVSIATPSINAQIGNMIYRNFHGKTSTQTYPLKIPAYGAKNFTVGNQKFFNILQDDDGSVTGKGFVGGVYLVGVDSEVSLGKSYGTVGDVYGDVVKSVDAGQGVVQDSDLVRMFAETAETTEQFDITFGNVVGRNVYKRIVKGASFPGVNFGDIWSFNPQDASDNYTLFAVVECLGTAKNLKFGDIYSEGPSERNVWMKGNGNKCGDIFDGAGGTGVIFGGPGEQAISCQVGNLLGRGLSGNSPQGAAVTLFNADKCQAGNITGLFAATVLTNTENVGRNSVGDITCNGRMDISNGATTVGAIDVDITTTTVAGSHYILGQNAKLTQTEIITDGRVTMSVTGPAVDVDLGRARIVRVSSQNGAEANHSIFTSASAVDGILKGKLEIEVNATIPGTPSGSSGRTLAYFTGLKVDDFDLSMNVTASIRGATGFHYWFNSVDGQANRLAVKSAISLVGSQISGKLGISKLENLVPGGSTVSCSGEVNVFMIEKEASSNVNGVNNTPMTANSTR